MALFTVYNIIFDQKEAANKPRNSPRVEAVTKVNPHVIGKFMAFISNFLLFV
jgi:hypothetical protein